MKKNLLLLILMLLPLVASADAVEIDGIYYNLVPRAKVAEVTSNPNKYIGDVVIPETVTYDGAEYSVTSIDERAFYQCSGLTSVTIPNSLTSIGETAFGECSGLTSVHISNIAAWCTIDFKTANSNPLYIAHHLYVNGEEVKDLIIPNSVTTIGNYAFYYCSGLTSVSIPNSVTFIGSYAFKDCSGLTSVTIPDSVTSIGNFAFCLCSGLTSVIIGNSVNSIGYNAFSFCKSLKSVTIPNSVTSIGGDAFYYCSGLTSITIPNSVTTIGNYAFYYCSGLTSVTIPNSVTSIRKGTFDSCSGLTSVNIGSGIQTIDSDAFAHCSKLTDVYCYAVNVPSTNANAFKYSYIDNSTLHVPAASVSTYQSASPWKNFKNIVALDGSTPYMQKCATPTINYVNGKLTFHCETDDVEFVYNVGVSGKGNDVEIKPMFTVSVNATTPMFTVSVYATKAGYEDSKVATKEISIEGIGLKGDVNGDGEVGIGDIISITNIMAE